MGQDKASIIIDGKSLLQRTCLIAKKAGFQPVVVRRPQQLLPRDLAPWAIVIEDAAPAGEGPLAGLEAALRAGAIRHQDALIVCPCDLPGLRVEDIAWLWQQRCTLTGDRRAFIPRYQQKAQPLFALYSPGLGPVIKRSRRAGVRSLKRLLARIRHGSGMLPPRHRTAALDADTPADLCGRRVFD